MSEGAGSDITFREIWLGRRDITDLDELVDSGSAITGDIAKMSRVT